MLGGEVTERAVCLTIELDEEVVPHYDDVGEVGVDERGGVIYFENDGAF